MRRISGVMFLACASPALAANVLINPGFETGNSQGWTSWRAPWGQQEQYTFNDTTAGHTGQFDLKITAKGSSFGVYQTVSVTPGHSYRLSAQWKVDVLSNPGWFEIMLLQGPYSYLDTDIRPGDLINKMYSYDSPENPPPPVGGGFGWLNTATLDGTLADINHYNGVRQATTTQMTVILKAGGNPNMTAGQSVVSYFDDVVLEEVPEPTSLLMLAGGLLLWPGRNKRLS